MDANDRALCRVIKAAIAAADPSETVTSLAPKIGLTYSQLSNVVNARTVPKPATVDKIRVALHLDRTWPDSEVRKYLGYGSLVAIEEEPTLDVTLMGNTSAGNGAYNVDPEARTVNLPLKLARVTNFAYVIEGDSMMPHLQDGDCACFKARLNLKHGYPFLFETADGGFLVKVAWFDRGVWYLRSYNRAYAPFRLPDGARPLGIFVGWYRRVGRRETMDMEPDGLAYDFEERFNLHIA